MDTCTHVHKAVVSPRRLVRAAVEPPPGQRLRRPYAAHVDIFLSFNHQSRREQHSPAAPSSLNMAPFYQRARRRRPFTLSSSDPESFLQLCPNYSLKKTDMHCIRVSIGAFTIKNKLKLSGDVSSSTGILSWTTSYWTWRVTASWLTLGCARRAF